MLNKQSLTSKTAIGILLILAGFLGFQEFRQFSDQKKIDAEKKNLQEQTDALSKKNDDLKQSLSYLNSPDFRERVARQQLNLKKDGEVVYSFSESDDASQNQTDSDKKTNNLSKWWNYFFAN